MLPIKTPVATTTTNLFLLEDIDADRTKNLAEIDRNALRAVGDWIKTFMASPHKDLGRAGPVCPFVPAALKHKTLWLAAERSAGRSAADVVRLVEDYKRLLLAAQPVDGDDANVRSIVVVFTDLTAGQAKDFWAGVLNQIGIPSYEDDGLAMGPFYEGNQDTAIYNPHFRPFISPVPFLLIRPAVISDWKFFLNNEDWLTPWARRHGEPAFHALAEELRRLPWRAGRD
ncbi:hypothetical protein H8B02_44445 [Bradyrhizobium sp. Pear77]|uniref:DUF6875 domain-containing protein n=1 Tax=Bradyrhizobium altum TaxID=1571202 RepID=UPI001E2EDC34|nr:hypothetical protein [Bradyrhizobium altum]MCC8960210.1 hypothetical protein [Bradyrhizobium altum]